MPKIKGLKVEGTDERGDELAHWEVVIYLRGVFEDLHDLCEFAPTLSAANDGLLYLPEPEEGDRPIIRQATGGYYDVESLAAMLVEYEDDREAIDYLADMLDEGDSP